MRTTIKLILFIFLITATSNVFLFAGTSTHDEYKKQHEKDKEFLKSLNAKLKCDIRKLKTEDVLKNKIYFDNIYKKNDEINLDLYGHKVTVTKYILPFGDSDISMGGGLPAIIFKIKDGTKEQILEFHLYAYISGKIYYKLPKMKEKILILANNSSKDSSLNGYLYVLSLEEKDYLKIIGNIPNCDDIDNDGYDELFGYDYLLSSNYEITIPYNDLPRIPIIYTIKDSKLVDDAKNNSQFYKKRIEKINNELKTIPRRYDKQKPNSIVLSTVLEKFLIYKILGEKENAWKEFEKDIKHYDDKVVYFNGKYNNYSKKLKYEGEIPIEIIKEKIQEQLKREEEQEKIKEIGKKFNCDIDRVKFTDIQKNKDLFNALYKLYSKETVDAYGIKLDLSIYHSKYNMFDAASIINIRSASNEVNIPIEYYSIKKIGYKIPNLKKQKALLIDNYNGGNAWNANKNYVISLEKETFLKVLGEIPGYCDVNKDGYDELCGAEDIWENGLDYFGHANAPGTTIFCKIENGKIVNDSLSYMDYYKKEIDRINLEIKQYPNKFDNTSLNDHLLSLILSKFLIYKTINKMDEGWKEFDKDIRHYDKDYFYFRNGEYRKIPIKEIKDAIKDSLAGY